MSLENFQIPLPLLPELYNNCLIGLDKEQIIEESLNTGEIPFLGGNSQQVLVLVNESDTVHIQDENLSFLLGILKACHLNMQDVALVNLHGKNGIDYYQLINQFKPGRIIGFGVQPSDIVLPIDFPKYQLQSYQNQVFLFSPALPTIAKKQDEKKALWSALKKMFSI